MGNFQREGVDYFETYASVMRTKTFRVLLQLLNSSPDHEMEHWDIKAAFINAVLEEETAHSDPYLGFTSHFTVNRPEPERALAK
jgi:hypothetical protein